MVFEGLTTYFGGWKVKSMKNKKHTHKTNFAKDTRKELSASAKVTAKQALNKQITSFDQTKLNIRQLLSTYFECVGIFDRW